MNEVPFVSLIIPCRNERDHMRTCLDSIVATDYPVNRLEVLVIDGMSEDGVRSVIFEYTEKYPHIRMLDNPARKTPAALNTGIRAAQGDWIIRMDAHAGIEKDYISQCVSAAIRHDADNVGGIMKSLSRNHSRVGEAIVAALSHPFGVGNSYFRTHPGEPREVDTVFGGCYKRSVFERIGLFNERLDRGQDMEFNLRLKKAGGRILLLPGIVSYYYARSEFIPFWKHNWGNGVWAILPFLHSEVIPVRLRHLVPLLFATALVGTAALSLLWPAAIWGLAVVVAAYLGANLTASVHAAIRARNLSLLFVLPMIFASLHIAYGFGSLWGILRLLIHLGVRMVRRIGLAVSG